MKEHQPNLFSVDPEPWELDDAEQQTIATVVFTEGLDGEFDYSVPEPLRARLAPGCRVEVPLGRGNRKVLAYWRRRGQSRLDPTTQTDRSRDR